MSKKFATGSKVVRFSVHIALQVAIGIVASSATAQNLVNNGNFHTGDWTGWTTQNYTNAGDEGVSPTSGNGNITGAIYQTYVDSASYFTISQFITTKVGHVYTESFDLEEEVAFAPGQPAQFDYSFGGQAVTATTSPTGIPQTITHLFTATSTSTEISFSAFNERSYYNFTNIDIHEESAPATPEPGTVAFLIGPMVCGVWAHRRKARYPK